MKKAHFIAAATALSLLSACNIGSPDAPGAAQIETAFASGDLGKTRRMIALAHTADVKSGKISLISAKVALARGDGIGAQTNLKAAAKAKIPQVKTLPLMAEALALQGKYDDAFAAADKTKSKAVKQHINGMQHWSQDNVWHAREAWEAAYKASPKNTRLALDLSRARSHLGLFPEARQIIASVKKAQPKNMLAPLALGELEMRARKYKAAAAAFTNVLKIAPGNSNALIGNARALYGMQDWKAAKRAVIALPRDIAAKPETQLLAAKISAHLGNYSGARTHFSNARDLVENDTEAQFLLGKLHLKDGRPYKAIRLIEAATNARPDLPEHHAELIRAYRSAGDETGAKLRLAKIPESLKGAKELQGI